MEKKMFIEPKIEIVLFTCNDVIRTSASDPLSGIDDEGGQEHDGNS